MAIPEPASGVTADHTPPSKYTRAFIIVTSLFFMWGFITVLVDSLIPRLKAVFTLGYLEAMLVQFAFFTAYLVVSVPGGALVTRIGYKRGVLVGLGTMAVACLLFYPAAELRTFPLFLLALFVLASGITILQVAANPYVAALGPARSASSRLNLSQAFNSLGTTIAPLVGATFILSSAVRTEGEIAALTGAARDAYLAAEASAVQGPFVVFAILLMLLAVVMWRSHLPQILGTSDYTPEGEAARKGSAWHHRHLVLGALAIFTYVGAEVAIGSFLVNYLMDLDIQALTAGGATGALGSLLSTSPLATMTPEALAGTFVTFYWGGAMVGRFIGSGLLRTVRPGFLLGLYALVAAVLVVTTMMTGGHLAMWSVLAIGLFNSIMFPTIFTLAIDGLGEHTPQGSGILCMAIFGGAIIPPLQGYFADQIGVQMAFFLPVLCYLYIAFYGFRGSRRIESVQTLPVPRAV